MSPEIRSLLMRGNRLLGAQLVEHNLIKVDDLDAANEKLLDILETGSIRQRTLLGILAYDLSCLTEEDLLTYQVETEGTGVVDLRHYEVNEELVAQLNVEACWATWTVPFDKEEDVTYIATAYYLSPPVRRYWEKQFEGSVLWYGVTIEAVAEFLEILEETLAADPNRKAGAAPESSAKVAVPPAAEAPKPTPVEEPKPAPTPAPTPAPEPPPEPKPEPPPAIFLPDDEPPTAGT